jgi:hypothetical protein
MLEGHEAISAILGLVMIVFVAVNRAKLPRALPSRILLASLLLYVASLLCSAIEVMFWTDTIDFLQHLLAPVSLVLLAIWSWRTFVRKDGASA